jgi:hypothetical protein
MGDGCGSLTFFISCIGETNICSLLLEYNTMMDWCRRLVVSVVIWGLVGGSCLLVVAQDDDDSDAASRECNQVFGLPLIAEDVIEAGKLFLKPIVPSEYVGNTASVLLNTVQYDVIVSDLLCLSTNAFLLLPVPVPYHCTTTYASFHQLTLSLSLFAWCWYQP